jgi:predicted transcriptional regulator
MESMNKKKAAFRPESGGATNASDFHRSPRRSTNSGLEFESWQLNEIQAGLADAEAGRVISHDELKSIAKSWRNRR